MSVYTRIEPDQLRAFLADYAVGEIEHYEGISEGITNTNYFVDTTLGRWVLTVFERLDASELPFYMDLMDHLASLGVPSAHPVTRRDGGFLSEIDGKPAALVYRLRGHSLKRPGPVHCNAFGAVVAEMHRAGESFRETRSNSRGLTWGHQARDELAPRLAPDTLALLDDELAFQARQDCSMLPGGVIHADLFRDNVLFEGEHVSGLIDFYYACTAPFLFDLAVICNDWCHADDYRFLPEHWQTLAGAYARRRSFTEDENAAWPTMLRAAALRFWLSRLYDWHFPTDGDVTHQKDPTPFARILENHRESTPTLIP